jgi:hypothetical protein
MDTMKLSSNGHAGNGEEELCGQQVNGVKPSDSPGTGTRGPMLQSHFVTIFDDIRRKNGDFLENRF